MPSSGRRPLSSSSAALLLCSLAAAMLGTPALAEPTSDEIRGELGEVRTRLEQLEVEANGVVDEYNTAAEALEAVTAEKAAAEAEFEGLAAEIEGLQDIADDHLRRLFKLGPALELATVMVAGDPAQTASRAATLGRILEGERGDLQELAAARDTLEGLRERIADRAAEADERAEELEERRGDVEAALADQRDEVERLNASLEAAVSREEAAARAAEAARRREAAEEARRERARAEAEATASADSTTTRSAESRPADEPSPDTGGSPAPAVRSNAQVAVDAALSRLGMPYRWGATGPNSFDCSGLMVWAWRQAGVSLPRTSASQFANLPSVSRAELRPGDLVFAGSPRVHHVGMYIGDGKIVHSPQTGRNVEIRSMERHDLRGFGRPG